MARRKAPASETKPQNSALSLKTPLTKALSFSTQVYHSPGGKINPCDAAQQKNCLFSEKLSPS